MSNLTAQGEAPLWDCHFHYFDSKRFTLANDCAYQPEDTLNHRVSDALWQEAVTSMGEQALIDLTVLSGTYVMVSMLLNATQIAIPGGAALPLEVLTPDAIRQGLLA